MCGICGIFQFGDGPPVDAAVLTRMRDTLVHRGPDDRGGYVSPEGRIGLGHRRLSIIDLSPAGRQPMTNEDGTVWITFNGEIWNHAALRRELEARGHGYASRTDTETILHLYEERGIDFLAALDGMFALALWDGARRRLILARDRTGKKPLFYTTVGRTFLFASELRGLLIHPDVGRELDEEGLAYYLTFVTTPPPYTLLRGIRKLPPGHRLVVDERGPTDPAPYWEPVVPMSREMPDEAECVRQVRALLEKAVVKRLMSDVPVGAFLSGGVDSSAIVALMSRHMDRRMQTFSAGFEGFDARRNFHDLPFAREVAALVGTDHHEVLLRPADMRKYLLEMPYQHDEPINDPCAIPQHFVAQTARAAGITVMLVGEGSDEIFCGYDDYVRTAALHAGRWRQLLTVPRLLRVALAALAQAGGASLGRRDLLWRAAAERELFWGMEIGFWDAEKRMLLTPHGRDRLMAFDAHQVVRSHLDRFRARGGGRTYLDDITYLEMKVRLPEYLLGRVDRITMASSLEARVPFLDTDLVEFALTIPPDLRVRGGTTKYILKRALEGVIPQGVLDRRKQGFRVPLPEWFREELGQPLARVLLGSAIHERQWFDRVWIERLLSAHRSGRADYSFKLWNLFILFAWHDVWIARRAVEV